MGVCVCGCYKHVCMCTMYTYLIKLNVTSWWRTSSGRWGAVGWIGFWLMAFSQGCLFRGGLNFIEHSGVTFRNCTPIYSRESIEP